MLIVMLMGGSGRRFVEAGYNIPKPFLSINDKLLVEMAVESTIELTGNYHYIINQDLIRWQYKLGKLPSGCWHIFYEKTSGPLQTSLMAKGCLDSDDDILLCDCDSTMNQNELKAAIEVFRKSGSTGGVTIRKTDDPNCSFARVDSQWNVEETREKDAFTSWSTTGPYWFRSGREYLEAANKAKNANHTSISPIYNYLRGRVKAVPVETFIHFGTPEEYEKYSKLIPSL